MEANDERWDTFLDAHKVVLGKYEKMKAFAFELLAHPILTKHVDEIDVLKPLYAKLEEIDNGTN